MCSGGYCNSSNISCPFILEPELQMLSVQKQKLNAAVFTWHGLSRSGGESVHPTILPVGSTSIVETSVVSISTEESHSKIGQ